MEKICKYFLLLGILAFLIAVFVLLFLALFSNYKQCPVFWERWILISLLMIIVPAVILFINDNKKELKGSLKSFLDEDNS